MVSSEQTETTDLLHIEGVYTWDKSIRVTAKVPVVLQSHREGGSSPEQAAAGLGNVILAVPLKRYFNLDGRTGSWTAAPQVCVPIGRPLGPTSVIKAWGAGLGLDGYCRSAGGGVLGGCGVAGTRGACAGLSWEFAVGPWWGLEAGFCWLAWAGFCTRNPQSTVAGLAWGLQQE